jgi:DnaJ-class molecular chaperone
VFQRGTEAYRVLVDPELRSEYDMALAKGQLRLTAQAVPSTDPSNRVVRSLDELCRTASGRRAAKLADALIGQGRLADAKRELQMALRHEGGTNADLIDRIDALDLALFAMGE